MTRRRLTHRNRHHRKDTTMTTTPQRIDEIRERLDKARPGLGEIDGGEELLKRRGNPKGLYTWTLYGTYADAILLVNAPDDLAWLLGEVERLSAERMQPEQPEPTGAEIRAAADVLEVLDGLEFATIARAALVAARKAARHE